MTMAKKVKCPACEKRSEYSEENPYRPFCSERCQMIDLGKWADEQYTIPTEEADPREIEKETTTQVLH